MSGIASMSDEREVVLSVGIITYNHADYIGQCLDSVLEQKVDFRYEIIVGDDGSTDSTGKILRDYQSKYPDIIYVQSGDNVGISENYKRVLCSCHGEFVALLEGDDFWSDPLKLQLQVDFLRGHQEYGFVGCYNQLLYPDGRLEDDKYDFFPPVQREGDWELYGDVFQYAKSGPVTRTVSICFRKSIIEPYIAITGTANDLVLQTILAKYSKFAKHKRSMAIYRQGGVSTDANSLKKQLYYNDWYVGGRLLQKRLFPGDCDWDERVLRDRRRYILLKDSIRRGRWRNAIKIKQEMESDTYRGKKYSRFLRGPVSCLALMLKMRINNLKFV